MLVLVNGDYVPQGNGLQSAKGDEAVLQRMLMKLTARRGQFPFMENFGSRLWTLDRLRPADRQAAAEQYVLLSLIHISEPTRLRCISYAVFCL